MLRINVHSSSDAAKSYFDRELKCGDYYANDQEAPGHWGGKLASQLDLSGTVDRTAFHRLCDNLLPDGSGKLTARTKANRRIGYDLNFHAPKSLSIAYELTGDDALREAFVDAVRETMGEVEQSAGCRVRLNSMSEDRTTGNLLWGEFIHRTARPVDGVPDPHLHAHVFVFNVTQDASEGKRKAGQFGAIVENAPTFEAHFHARLAAKVKAIGYQTIETKNGCEIAGVPESTRLKFSRRSQQIKDYADANGITDPAVIDRIGAETRQAKARGQGMTSLRRMWLERLNDAERAALADLKPSNTPSASTMTATAALDFAISHCFERATLMPLHWIIRTALRHAAGAVNPEQLEDAIAANTELVIRPQGNRTLATTHTALREERHFMREVRQARGTVAGLHPGYVPPENFLREEERQVVRRVLTSRDRITAIRGVVGYRKAELMQQVKDGIEQRGRRLIALNGHTAENFLGSTSLQEAAKGQVVWIDEAGIVGIPALNEIIAVCQTQKARVLLTGETGHHSPIERADVFRLLSLAELRYAEIWPVPRQKPPALRQAVQAFQNDRADIGLSILDMQGAIHAEPDGNRPAIVGERYAKALLAGESAIAFSPTPAEAEAVTAATRTALKRRGFLQAERAVIGLADRHLTAAEKADSTSYHPGDIVQFLRSGVGFRAGERLHITSSHDGEVKAKREEGNGVILLLADGDRFNVYQQNSLRLAAGDLVRLTRDVKTMAGHRLTNGTRYRVCRIGTDGIRLDNGETLPLACGHLAYGYVSTSGSAPSATVDHVLISQQTASLRVSPAEQFYASCRRARCAVDIYTDDPKSLQASVARRSTLAFGHDLSPSRLYHADYDVNGSSWEWERN